MVPHADVLAAIDNALRPDRLGIDVSHFRQLMREIAIVESGYKVGGSIQHKNDLSKAAKGVFQITNIALDQLREKTTIPKTKAKLDASGAFMNPWEKQTNSDIFGSLKMQAIAAAMYVFYLYLNRAGSPDLSSDKKRAEFWKEWYNTPEDQSATVEKYLNKVREFID